MKRKIIFDGLQCQISEPVLYSLSRIITIHPLYKNPFKVPSVHAFYFHAINHVQRTYASFEINPPGKKRERLIDIPLKSREKEREKI